MSQLLDQITADPQSVDVLPDSRLGSDRGSAIVDWQNPDGSIVRIEVVPTYCANCGKLGDFVPKENTSFAFYLCQDCCETHGAIAGVMAVPDELFWAKVEAEMLDTYGHALNAHELSIVAAQGWGPLAKLVKESPVLGKV